MSQPHTSHPDLAVRKADNEEDRIRMVFGLPSDAPLPAFSKEALLKYHEYLARNLKFPFHALYAETTAPVNHLVRYVTVVGLSDSARRRLYGLFCKVQVDGEVMELPLADLGIREDDPNRQLVDDYVQWLWSSH